MSEPMIKGAILRDFVVWYGERYGTDSLKQTAALLPEEFRAIIDIGNPTFHLLGSLWYPARLVHAFLEALAHDRTPAAMNRLMHEANRSFLKTGARHSVYRFLLERLVTPEIYAVCVPRFWKQLHSTGERRMKIVRRGYAESTVFNWPGHHPLLCTMVIETMCTVFESMGCKNVSWERATCVSDGARECKTLVSWQ
ncbi:MAG: hypothetical protein ABI183_22130 [Polyangiaceae bacterium]